MNKITHSEQETQQIGIELASHLQGGDVVCLYGDLGAGKTTLVKGIANGLNINEEITSPTFTLMNVYQIPANYQLKAKKLAHIDTYRLKNEKEFLEIGGEDYIGKSDTVCIVEWPEKIERLLKNKKIINIFLKHINEQERSITIND